MARLVDIATATGVSVGLVSRVLNNAPSARATPETRKRILAAAEELGYRPNHAARALRLSRSYTLGLVVPDLTNALFAPLVSGVEQAAADAGLTMLLGRTETLVESKRLARLLDEGRVDGFLFQGRDDLGNQAMLQLLGTAPVIVVNSMIEGRPGSVRLDDAAAAATAVRHLVGAGHSRIALATGVRDSLTARLRAAGFESAMIEADLDPATAVVSWHGYQVDDGAAAMRTLLAATPRPTAIVVANVNAAFGLLTEARVHRVAIPEDLSVVAIHDAWTADHCWPPLTTVRMPLYQLGVRAVELLTSAMQGQALDEVVQEPGPQLVPRESVLTVRSTRRRSVPTSSAGRPDR